MQENPSRLSLLLKLLKYTKKYFPAYIIGFIALIIIDATELLIPAQTGKIIDLIKIPVAAKVLTPYFIRIIIFVIIIVLLRFVWRYMLLGTARKIETDIRSKLYKKLSELSGDFYTANKTGDLMSYFTNDLSAIRMVSGPGFLMISDFVLLTILVISRMLITTDPVLTLIACLPLPIITVVSMVLTSKMHTLFEEKQAAFGKLSDVTQEFVTGIRIIKSFVQYTGASLRFNQTNKTNVKITRKTIQMEAFIMSLVEFVIGCSFLSTLLYGGYLTSQNKITIGEFVAFYEYLVLLIWPFMALGWGINIISKGLSSVKRVEKLLQLQPQVFDSENAILYNGRFSLSFRNLSYKYGGIFSSNFSLDNVSLQIPMGKTTAITGRTGSGKTTIINLLTRLENPPRGTVFIGDTDILDIKLDSLHSILAVVPQDVFLFSTTIKENITIASDSASEEDIKEAARIASLDEAVENFPDSYNTIIGERGVTLSGGQKQRLTIARALIRKAPILILDDAMSALDVTTEKSIVDAIKKERADRTTIIISHRISSIMDADSIAVMDEGRIVETGTHIQLIARGGLYKELFERQKLEEEIDG